jgi:hypothetical protein
MLRLAFCVFPKPFTQFEEQFDANPSLLHISHFSMSVRSQNNTKMTSQKCTQKTHTFLQLKAAW